MHPYTETIEVHVALTGYGDALFYGALNTHHFVSGQSLKQRLFAWHAPSFYGTELETRQIEEIELVVLPAEEVIPFFSEMNTLLHIEWKWDEQAEHLIRLAPVLAASIDNRKYIPSFTAFRSGQLQWTWDPDSLKKQDRTALGKALEQTDESYAEGLSAAYSASVFQQWYSTEEAATDLRREFPQLFPQSGTAPQTAGMDAQSWLVSIGWKADAAPFRPLLQLLEPEEDEPAWRLRLVLQNKLDAAVLVPVRLDSRGRLEGEWPDVWTPFILDRSAGWLEQLRAHLPRIRRAISGSRDVLSDPLGDQDAWLFLTQDSGRLLEAGWQVLLPGWWEAARKKKPKLRAKVKPEEGSERGQSFFGLDSIIHFDWRIAIGDTDLSEEEFADLVARNERLVRFRGEWVPLDPALLEQIRRAMGGVDQEQGLSFQDILHLHLLHNEQREYRNQKRKEGQEEEEEQPQSNENIRLEVELNEHLNRVIAQLGGGQGGAPSLPIPEGLHAELRSYQKEGFAWLGFLRRFGLGACLADDMGLGKTIQFITYLLHLKEHEQRLPGQAPALLVCPTSVLGNWQKEISRFAPSINVSLHYGARRLSGEEFREQTEQVDIIITSYATATLDQEMLQSYTWASICLDEAQNIKNAQTKQSMAVRSFPAKHRIALTGTPIENRLSELWSIYDFINPGYLGSARAFQTRFISAIEKDKDEQRMQDLQQLVKPFMLRRKKKDPNIQLDLPDKNEMKTYIHLTGEQSALYDQSVQELMDKMKELEGIKRKGAILSALTQLKQLCDHPLLLTKEALPETLSSEGSITEYDLYSPQDMAMLISRSAKLERLMELVRELRDEGERCLIFTQYIGMGQMLQQVLRQELQEPVLYLHGGTSKTARDRMIDEFQSRTLPAAEQPSVFILSIKAGGVGLNLTAANHVFHFDRWWNPAVENQATDRAYRMGQTKDVQVHKFISLGTLEERIDEMLESKQQLSDNIITSSENWITELSTDELKDLFTRRRDWSG
ncbi:ATP-dependent helicase [Paenibacillus taichungensis]|uniref:ATP-dependent helicase n=1 Tax=Paenibacillus taichungensis TaxID=484184 RepID=A0A329QBM5_9BACL|nr:DEAD/DEAH box helicase [Paenibacillus taichungensis]RAW09805.1 ATP-dependent helicase [Paenibacillus taichungensis]